MSVEPKNGPRDARVRQIALIGAALIIACAAAPALAERPMSVDDAATGEKGSAELEFGWVRDHKERGGEASFAYIPLENLKVELGYSRVRDHDPDPSLWAHGLGVALKWVPLQAETGLSAGLRYDYERARVDLRGEPDEVARANAVTALLSWGFASGQHVHLNIGREWVLISGTNEVANTWGVGFEQPLGERFTLGAEVFGAEDGRPDRQIGLRYEVVDGFTVSGAVGRGSDRTIANVGCAWEF